jgi:molybdenum cofactor cytidylyltransferase
VLPAGGHSARMGRPKLALPLGSSTVLEHVIAALRAAGMEHVLVVVGPHVPELVPLAEEAGAHVCRLSAATPDMRATVEAGLSCLEERFRPGPADAWLLVPADHPTLDTAVVGRLEEARRSHSRHSIFVPAHEGRRGHPTLLAWKHVAGIRAHPPGEGLNTYVRRHAAETLEVAVESADVLCDLDTPEDYERLLQRLGIRHQVSGIRHQASGIGN